MRASRGEALVHVVFWHRGILKVMCLAILASRGCDFRVCSRNVSRSMSANRAAASEHPLTWLCRVTVGLGFTPAVGTPPYPVPRKKILDGARDFLFTRLRVPAVVPAKD